MDRDGSTTQAVAAGTSGFDVAIKAVAGTMARMRPLRQERDRLMERHVAGLADAEDLRRYRTTRLRLLMLESANQGVRPPRRTAEVMADKRRLDFVELVGHRDQFPEPQPS